MPSATRFLIPLALLLHLGCGGSSDKGDPTGPGPDPTPPEFDGSVELLTHGLLLLDIWGVDGSLFACGEDGLLVRNDGDGWKLMAPMSFENLQAIAGTAADDIWAVGEDGRIVHFDGTRWQDSVSPTESTLTGVWCASDGTAWAVGWGGTILRYTPASGWVQQESPYSGRIHALDGLDGNNLFASADGGTLLIYDGSEWTTENAGTVAALMDLWVAETGEVWCTESTYRLVHRRTNGTWEPVFSGSNHTKYVLWGNSADDIYAAGAAGGITHFDGSSWSPKGIVFVGGSVQALWGTDSETIYAVGTDGRVAQGSGAQWELTQEGRGSRMKSIWGAQADDIHFLGQDATTMHYDGSKFEIGTLPINSDVYDAWGASADLIWASTAGGMMEFDGTQWSALNTGFGGAVFSIFGTDAEHVLAVGLNGLYATRTSAGWQSYPPPTSVNLNAVWGASSESMYIAGDGGWIYLSNLVSLQGSWNSDETQTTENLYGAWGFADDDVFFVGGAGTILHFDGSRFRSMNSGVTSSLRSVWGWSNDDVWAVGDSGTALHYDGTGWAEVETNTHLRIHDVYGFSGSEVYFGLDRGIVLRASN